MASDPRQTSIKVKVVLKVPKSFLELLEKERDDLPPKPTVPDSHSKIIHSEFWIPPWNSWLE